ncbi:MAG: hypothetical protein AAFO89_00350 [Planctomycetota bacterium]
MIDVLNDFVFHGRESLTEAVPFFFPTRLERDFRSSSQLFAPRSMRPAGTAMGTSASHARSILRFGGCRV